MPFLEKKTDSRGADGRDLTGVTATGSLLWAGDEYRPSSLPDLGTERPGAITSAHVLRRICGSTECLSTWTTPWRSRRRPIFEGQWGCSGRCVLAMVRAAVRREFGDGETRARDVPHRHRVPLGLLMLAQGWITQEQLRKALEAQRASGTGRIGDWLQAECGVGREKITRGLSMQWGCPVLPVTGFVADVMALVMPKIFVEEFGLLPIRTAASKMLYLGFEDRLDASAALALEQMTELRVESGLVEGAQFREARSRLLECRGVDARLESTLDTGALAGRVTAILEQRQPIASRLVRLHHFYWLRLWLEKGAMSGNGYLPQSCEDVMDHVFTVGGRA